MLIANIIANKLIQKIFQYEEKYRAMNNAGNGKATNHFCVNKYMNKKRVVP